MLRIQGDQVDASVPGWLLNAVSTQSTMQLAKRAAFQLAARPEYYGFDPAATYSIFVQSWDRATTDLLSVAYGRNVVGHSRVGLLLDFYYTASHGFRDLRRAAIHSPRWAERSDRLVWRGSVTGNNEISDPGDLPRIKLALASREWPDADIGLTGVHHTMNNARPSGLLDAFVTDNGLRRDRWDMADFGNYKYVIDIDGHANAWGFLEKLILGCCVLKVDSPYEQWFYDRIKPWEHFVPVRSDLSNLREIATWCRDNDAQCRWIAANASRLAASLTLENELPYTCRALMAAAHVQRAPSWPNRVAEKQPIPLFRLEDAALLAEDGGSLESAVGAYQQLVDAGCGTAGMLMRRSDLLRQRGDFALSETDMKRAVAAEPENDEAALRYGQFLAMIGRHAAAVRLLAPTVRLKPERAEIRISLAGSCLKLGWLDMAYWAVRDLPDSLPDWWADLREEVLQTYAERRDEVIEMCRTRRAARSLTLEQAKKLALALFEIGRLRPTWWLRQEADEQNPVFSECSDLAIRHALRRGGVEQALHCFSQNIQELEMASGDAAALRANLLFDQGRYQDMLEVFSKSSDHVNDTLRSEIAIALIMTGRKDDLRSYCRRWMEQWPHDIRPAELVCAAQPAEPLSFLDPVPLSIGQYWDSGALPEAVREIINSWPEAHSGLNLQLYDLEHARAFIRDKLDEDVVEAFDLCRDPVTRAGYFRLAWLYSIGGVWISSDQRCIRAANQELTAAARSQITAVRSGYIAGYLQDMFLGAQAASGLIKTGLQTATAMIHEANALGQPLWSWRAVGPGLLTKLVADAICSDATEGSKLLLTPMLYNSFASKATLRASTISN